MKKLLTIFFFLPSWLFHSKPAEKPVVWAKHYQDDTHIYDGVRIGTFIDTASYQSPAGGEKGVRYSKYYIDGSMETPIRVAFWTNYTWSASNGLIRINRTNYPALHAGDSVLIPIASGGNGYWDRQYANLNAGAVPNPANPATYITIYWEPGAFITPQTSSVQGNSVDSLYGVHEVNMHMSHHPDPLDFYYAMTGYLQYFWRDRDTCIACGGLWGSAAHTLTLTPYVGHADTAHMFYMDSISNSCFDSVGTPGPNDGQTTAWFGDQTTAKNNIWGRLGISNTYFGHNPSTNNPACFIHLLCVFRFTIINCTFEALGSMLGSYSGHAGAIFSNDSYGEVKGCHFKSNFGDCWRDVGSAGLADFPALNQLGSIHNCIDSFPIKYPFHETRKAAVSDSQYCPGLIPRAAAVVANITFAHPAMGVGHQYYNCSMVDAYSGSSANDSIRIYNCLQYGPTDTLATVCTSQGCNAFLTQPNGAITYIDTAGNIWSQTLTFAGTGLADSVHFIPQLNGLLYGHGVLNAYVTSGVDANGVPWPISGRIDAGANMLSSGPCTNCLIFPFRVNIH